VAIESKSGTPSLEEQPPEVRVRRAAVMAGVGLVWAAFMASIGLVLLAVVVLLAVAAGAAWTVGARLPRLEVRVDGAKARAEAKVLAARTAAASGRSTALARNGGRFGAPGVAVAARHVSSAAQAAVTSSLERARRLSTISIARPRLSRRRNPRVDRALAWNSEGIAFARAGRHAEAIDAFDSALALLAETGDRHHEGQVLANLGTVHRKVGGTEAARFCWSKALERLEPGTPESERTAELLGVR
jgi:tetratricopeptide (TPR) repeat protein